MRTVRFILTIGAGVVLIAALAGCLQQSNPQALFTASMDEHVVPFTVSFDGSLSYNAGGEIVDYLWTFGDGGSETGQIVEHVYVDDGVYQAKLTVIDERGLSSSSILEVHALNPPPTAGFSYTPRSNLEGVYFVSCSEAITFDAQDMCDDDGTIVSYEWYFGYRDAQGEPVTAIGPVVTHEFLYAGTYNVTLTVTDNDGGVTEYVEKLDVKGGPPCNADITGDIPWNGGGTCS